MMNDYLIKLFINVVCVHDFIRLRFILNFINSDSDSIEME